MSKTATTPAESPTLLELFQSSPLTYEELAERFREAVGTTHRASNMYNMGRDGTRDYFYVHALAKILECQPEDIVAASLQSKKVFPRRQ